MIMVIIIVDVIMIIMIVMIIVIEMIIMNPTNYNECGYYSNYSDSHH